MSAPASVLAVDVALCRPKLRRGELRAVARPIEGASSVRLTVVATDRPGLLADTAGVLATHRLSITEASAATWPARNLAMHALTLADAADFDEPAWERLGHDLRDVGIAAATASSTPPFVPRGRAAVTVDGSEPGRVLVRVTADDQVGLLWAICRWFADQGHSIESLHAATDRGKAHDVFLVAGSCEAPELARHLSR
jgi:[protein-PII] uridylyltransferase